MSYDLYLGDRTFSSWSLRGWLMFEKFDIDCRPHMVGLYRGTLRNDLADLAPARLVPVMRCPDGTVVGETPAMAETLAERHPDAGLWPREARARALARWLVSEMHAGFVALRNECPMQLERRYQGFAPSPAVRADLARLQELWQLARARHGTGGPWLFGDYSLADVFFAPVAARIAGYDLPVEDEAAAQVRLHLADPAFRRWRAMGLCRSYDPWPYPQDLPVTAWPGPAPLVARALDSGPAINDACPFSGKPVTHFLEIATRPGPRVVGFCNAFCRDKTGADPLAWPQVASLLDG